MRGHFSGRNWRAAAWWCCSSWIRMACRCRRPDGRKTRKTTQDGAAGQRREGARGRSVEKQNEQKRGLQTYRPRPDFRGSTTTPRSSTTHCQYCYGERRSVPTPEIPSFSSMRLRLPMAQSVLFALVSKTTQPHFLSTSSLKRWTNTSCSDALPSSGTPSVLTGQRTNTLLPSNIMCLIVSAPRAAPNLKGAALRSLDSWLSYCFELDCHRPGLSCLHQLIWNHAAVGGPIFGTLSWKKQYLVAFGTPSAPSSTVVDQPSQEGFSCALLRAPAL